MKRGFQAVVHARCLQNGIGAIQVKLARHLHFAEYSMDAVPFRRPHAQRWRHLTAGEIAMALQLFRDAIDYCRVRIYSRRYLPYLQSKNCDDPQWQHVFPSFCFLDDYSQANLTDQHWFTYEMVNS